MSLPIAAKNNNVFIPKVTLSGSSQEIGGEFSKLLNAVTVDRWQSCHKSFEINSTKGGNKLDFTIAGAGGSVADATVMATAGGLLTGIIDDGQRRAASHAIAAAKAMNDIILANGGDSDNANFTCVYVAGVGFTVARAAGTWVGKCATGANKGVSAWPTLGFSIGADTSSAASHASLYLITTTGGSIHIRSVADNDGVVNNLIKFTKGGAHTGTIPDGEYTCLSFCSAVAAAMDAADTTTVNNWTRDESFPWSFRYTTSSGTVLKLSVTTDTVWGTIQFTTGVDSGSITDTNGQTFVNTCIHDFERIVFDYGDSNAYQVDMSTISLFGFNWTSNVSVEVDADAAAAWGAPSTIELMTYVTPDLSLNKPINMVKLVTPTHLRYTQIWLSDPQNSAGFVDLGAVWFSDYFTATHNCNYTGITKDTEVKRFRNDSLNGVVTGNITSQLDVLNATYEWLPDATDRLKFDILFNYSADIRPVFLLLDMFGNQNTNTHLAMIVSRPQWTRKDTVPDLWVMTLSIRDAA